MKRRGVSLVELLVSLTLLPAVIMVGVVVVRGGAAEVRRLVRVVGDARISRGLEAFFSYELAGMTSAELALSSPTQLRLARKIGNGAVCAADARSVTVALAEWSAVRVPDPTRDDLLLVDAFGHASVMRFEGAAPASCPDGGPGLRLTTGTDLPIVRYLRVREPVRVSVYRSGPSDWLGLAPADGSSSVQPFAGPILPGSGRFTLAAEWVTFEATSISGTPIRVQIPLSQGGAP